MTCLVLSCLCGCLNPSRGFLKSDSKAYSIYNAQANDEQMLLNLSRLANNDPVYFMQLSGISSEYSSTLSGGVTPSNTRNTPGTIPTMTSTTAGSIPPSGANTVASSMTEFTKNAFTFGGTLNSGMTQTPTFSFVPLTGSNVVNAVFVPISPEVFYTLYDLGWPADLLARTMVRSVIRTNHTAGKHMVTYMVNSPGDPSYPEFLRFCSKLRTNQLGQLLVFSRKPGHDNVVFASTEVRLAEVVSAIQSNLTVTSSPFGVVTVTKTGIAQPGLIPNISSDSKKYTTALFQVEASRQYSDAEEFANDFTNCSLQMLSVESAMYTAAREERYFRDYLTNPPLHADICYEDSRQGPVALVEDTKSGKTFEVHPLLTLTQAGNVQVKPEHRLVEIPYAFRDRADGQPGEYFIGDYNNRIDNRTVFTILTYLFAQTGVSTQNLPVQQLIHLQ